MLNTVQVLFILEGAKIESYRTNSYCFPIQIELVIVRGQESDIVTTEDMIPPWNKNRPVFAFFPQTLCTHDIYFVFDVDTRYICYARRTDSLDEFLPTT